MTPLAYHLTWTTYGTWLSGDARCWVESGTPGTQDPDPVCEEQARRQMAESAITLSAEQRAVVETTIRDHCRIRGWTLHAVNVRSNHVHVVVTADRAPEEVMNPFKAWCSRKLSDQVGLANPVARNAGRRRWWTEHGSTKWINDEEYLQEAIDYVFDRQGT
jgi:REP element-mobilizing transposase RayT